MSMSMYEMEPEITALVAAQLPKSAMGLPDFITPELVGSLVRTGLDALVIQFGAQGEAFTQAWKAQVRTFVSANTLRYLEGLIAGMQDLKASLPQPE
jgi:hypothetical protein